MADILLVAVEIVVVHFQRVMKTSVMGTESGSDGVFYLDLTAEPGSDSANEQQDIRDERSLHFFKPNVLQMPIALI